MRCEICERCLIVGQNCPEHPEIEAQKAPPPPASPDVEGYRCTRHLGGGGFSDVFAATELATGQVVALKIGHRAVDARMQRESQILAKLSPGIAPALLDRGVTGGGFPYLAMELIEGEPLCRWLASREQRKIREVLSVFRCIAATVDRLHHDGFIHRDLKPENILLAGESIRLIDFGIARHAAEAAPELADPSLTRTGERIGTPLYMAPEQCAESRGVDAAADRYALGVIAFEMLVGRPPFSGNSASLHNAHMTLRPPRASSGSNVPAAFDAVLERAMAKNPAERFAAGADLSRALADAVDAPHAIAPTVADPEQSSSGGDATTRRMAIAALLQTTDLVAVKSALSSLGGVLYDASGDRVLVAFPTMGPEAGVRAAWRLRREGAARRVVIHVASLRQRERRGRIRLMGRALQEPHNWLAHLPEDEELALTEAAAQLLGRQALRPVGDGRFYGPDLAISGDSGQAETGQPDEPALVGRDELLRELEDIARSCDLERVPAFVTTVGAAGLGKTRLLRELERRLSSGFLHRVHYLRGSDDQGLLTRLTCAALALEPESMTLDAVRDAVSDLCGDPQSDTEWVCLALSSGLLDPSEPRAGRLLRAPGAFRATTARVLAIGLRQQARTRATAILVDDLHRCQPAVLDALEIAAMEGESRIFVCGSARPDLLQTRPAWGDRPARDFRKTLPALTTSESAQLLSELLRPADYVAHDLVEQLREATAGIPGHLVDVAHAIRAGGGIRRLPGTRAYEVVVDEELINPSTPLAQRLAARQVASLAPELHRFVELCAVWGAPLVALELSEFQNTLPEGDPGAALDAWVGLQRLQRLQLVAKHDAPGFRSAELERGILAALSPARRRDLHRHALAWLQHRASGTADDARRIARHATYLGERDLAADAWLQLAGEAATLHHYDRAERYFGAALDGCRDHDNERRRLALQGRGRMRYRLWRLSEARADLERAAELTAEGPDSSSAAPLLFEQAIILDWSYDFAAAAAMTERAVAAAADSEDPLLGVHSKFARARTLYRSEQLSDAIPLLRESAEAARALGDYELRTIALLVLGMGLVYTKRHDEAEEAFAAVIESCEAAGDRFHCAAALVNRMNLWMGMGNYENAVADSRRAVEIARELGNAQIERGATYNLAELLGWSGSLDEAIAMATRCRELQLKYCEATEPEISILCARLHSIRGEHDEAQRLLDWISEHCASHPVPPSQQLLIDMVRLRSASERNEHAWSELLRQAEEKSISDERFEILYGCADHALRCRKHEQARRTLERARGMQELAPQWRARFSELEAALGR